MLREERQAKILEIIAKQEIETQEELCNALNQANYSVTQATVSRDIKSLHLFKIKGTQKRSRYSHLQQTDDVALPGQLRRLFKESVLSICSAGNLVVIKTLSGSASNAGLALDKLNYSEVVGTVAGDDTLLVVCKDTDAAISVVEKIRAFLN